MKNLYRATALAAALSVVSCAAPPNTDDGTLHPRARVFKDDYDADLCKNPNKCEIVVTVEQGCVIKPHPYTYGMPRGMHNVDITWTIDPKSVGNAAFTSNGIAFKTANSEFEPPRQAGAAFKAKDKNPNVPGNPMRGFPYTITVTQGGVACPPLDPTVINDY